MCAAVLDYDGKDGHVGVPLADVVATWEGCFGFLHTTKSHSPEAPSFRVILPFSRPVTPAEYARIWGVLEATEPAEPVDPLELADVPNED